MLPITLMETSKTSPAQLVLYLSGSRAVFQFWEEMQHSLICGQLGDHSCTLAHTLTLWGKMYQTSMTSDSIWKCTRLGKKQNISKEPLSIPPSTVTASVLNGQPVFYLAYMKFQLGLQVSSCLILVFQFFLVIIISRLLNPLLPLNISLKFLPRFRPHSSQIKDTNPLDL